MPSKTKREYRNMMLKIIKREAEDDPNYKVEGYASTFEPYVLYEFDGIEYKEQIDPHAFDECDMSDVVFRIDHEGKVYARTSAGTLNVDVDEHGLHNVADLGKTQSARELYEDIEAGNYPKMSFAFTVREDSYDRETHTRTIMKIDKLYDVSPVSFPANPTTELSVSTRDYFNGVIEAEKAERLEAERKAQAAKKLKLRIKLMKELVK